MTEECKKLVFQPKRGAGREKNLASFIDALYAVAHNGAGDRLIVKRESLPKNLLNIYHLLRQLDHEGYLKLIYDTSSRGRPLHQVVLEKRKYKEKIQNQGDELVPYSPQSLPEPVNVRKHTILFIDYPNIRSRRSWPEYPDYWDIELYRFNPHALIGCLTYQEDVRLIDEAYIYLKRPWDVDSGVSRRAKATRLIPVCNKFGKDIDAIMCSHMIERGYKALEEENISLKIIVVSGDHGFSHPISTIKKMGYEKQIPILVQVVSWMEKLSPILKIEADSILYMEDIHDFIDPVGNLKRISSIT